MVVVPLMYVLSEHLGLMSFVAACLTHRRNLKHVGGETGSKKNHLVSSVTLHLAQQCDPFRKEAQAHCAFPGHSVK